MADKTFRIAVSRSLECKQTTVVEVVASSAAKAKQRAIDTVEKDHAARDWAHSFGSASNKLNAEVI